MSSSEVVLLFEQWFLLLFKQISLIFVQELFAAFLVEKGFLGFVQDCSFCPCGSYGGGLVVVELLCTIFEQGKPVERKDCSLIRVSIEEQKHIQLISANAMLESRCHTFRAFRLIGAYGFCEYFISLVGEKRSVSCHE